MNNQRLNGHQEPIVALASGQTAAAIAILRISGQGCLELSQKILKPHSSKEWQHGKMRLCHFVDPKSGNTIDEPMAVFFQGPKSFTGEDSVEIYLHGGRYIIQTCLKILLGQGFRAALPGEFTQRAFLNGKMDLSSAEGIKELIDAASEQQWLAARQTASGKLADIINQLRKQLVEAMAWLEARIDFPEEKETSAVEMQEVKSRVDSVRQTLEKLENSYTSGHIAANGLRVALFGKPNCGKSTLMNRLLDNERAIVTDTAGTTRDYLEESCQLQGRLIRLVDTAGVRDSSDKIEQLGVERSIEIAKEADIVLFMLDAKASQEDEQELKAWIKKLGNDKFIKVVSKSDLNDRIWDEKQISISCSTGSGLDKLKQVLIEKVDAYIAPLHQDHCFITSARHLASIKNSLGAIERFDRALEDEAFEEMLAFELQESAKFLAEIIGRVDNEDLLDTIFSSFCVGK